MGQTQSKPKIETRLVNERATEEQCQPIYSCQLSSPKHSVPMLLTTHTTRSAHGTRFVYFQTPRSIHLTDYNVIVCGLKNMPFATIENKTFHVASLVYDTRVVCKGVHYYQFITPIVADTRPPCRLLARFKCSKNSSHTRHSTIQKHKPIGGDFLAANGQMNMEQTKDSALAQKNTKMVWVFVWEIHSVA